MGGVPAATRSSGNPRGAQLSEVRMEAIPLSALNHFLFCPRRAGLIHVEGIFEICHFSPRERQQFLAAYNQAHPRRLQLHSEQQRVRRVTLTLPDLGDERRNKQIEDIVAEFAEKVARVLRDR